MSLDSGAKLGPYEIISLLGAGGMGEVYRARDSRLNRHVAVKVLPEKFAADPDRLRRFEQEARATGVLNHPNILVVFDIGTVDGVSYVVSELLEGETLRERLAHSPLPVRKAVEYAIQMARGLAAAHEKGVVHRDLKPENVFITKGGLVKILDFGLAKLMQPSEAPAASEAHTAGGTEAGVVLGTAGYMSPEQVRGKEVDHRSDLFSFGAILYEMLAGARAFSGDSSIETMNAILKDDLPDLSSRNNAVPPALNRLVRRCMEKNPDERFRSAHDIAFALEALSEPSNPVAASAAPESRPAARPNLGAALGFAALLLMVAAFLVGRRSGFPGGRQTTPAQTFHRLSFRRGTVRSARFSTDGKTILYGAAWDGEPLRIFSTRPESLESTRFPLGDADILSISSQGELAVSLGRTFDSWVDHGTLALVPGVGGSAREVLEKMSYADWTPDGKELAITRHVNARDQLEFPIGKVLLETEGYFSNIRFSPKGDRIAFLDHPLYGDNRGSVAVVDLQGKKTTLSGEFAALDGMAWNPDTNEIWYTGSKGGEKISLYATDLSGKERMVLQVPSDLYLHDLASGGRALLSAYDIEGAIFGTAPGETNERNLAALNNSIVTDISQDGRRVALTEFEAASANYDVYVRNTDGSAPVRLGEGFAWGFSPDGKWVAATTFTPPGLHVLPTGAGEAKHFKLDLTWGAVRFLTDDRIVIVGRMADGPVRAYALSTNDGKLEPLTEGAPKAFRRGFFGDALITSPDGSRFVISGGSDFVVYSASGKRIGAVPGIESGDFVVAWSNDLQKIFVATADHQRVRIFKVDLVTGKRDLWREISAADPAGLVGNLRVTITPGGKEYAYVGLRDLSSLYLVEGLK